MGVRYFGAAVNRTDDARLVTGHGRYVDDIDLPRLVHACFVRSAHAHARLRGIDAEAARRVPGVVAVLTLDDFDTPFRETRLPQPYPAPILEQPITQYPLAKDEVCYVGEAVAVVLADSRHAAEDGVAAVEVDYEPLPAVVDCRRALADGAPRAHAGAAHNRVARIEVAFGDVDQRFAAAEHIFPLELVQHRGGCHAMECRGVIVEHDRVRGELTLWSSTQCPYLVRRNLSAYLGIDEGRLRVIAPDVGGGFGPKAAVYPEEYALALTAMALGRPVKWIEDRREHFLATNTQRDQLWSLEVASDGEGRILGLRGHVIHDNGAYVPYGLLLPLTSLSPLPGPYAIPGLRMTMDVVFTNTTPNSPVRGAGRPYAAFAIERAMTKVARELGIDQAEIRRRNFVRADQMPYDCGQVFRDGTPVRYDSGDFHTCLDRALALADYAGFAKRRTEAREQGRFLGVGVSSCIEDTGVGPFEGATVSVQPDGAVMVRTGAASQGQGHETVIAQICADRLDVDLSVIYVVAADTGAFPHGVGTIGSRVAVNVATSVCDAADAVRDKALRAAAHVLEAAFEDLFIEDGVVRVQGVPEMTVTLGELSKLMAPMVAGKVPGGLEPGLEATSYRSADGMPHANGSNVAEVEVDIGTGAVKLLRYSVGHDCGRMINPKLVDGQIIGGVVHGIGNALFERMVYDGAGQPMTTNYSEYLLAGAAELPPIAIAHHETPSPLNPMGVKGAGEGGTIPAAPAVVAAIEDALASLGIEIDFHPVDPERLCALIERARVSTG